MKKQINIFFMTVVLFACCVWLGSAAGVIHFETGHDGHGKADIHQKKDAHDHDEEKESAEGVHLTPEQQKIAGIRLSAAALGKINQQLELHGEVRLNADRTAKMMQWVPGFVSKVFVREGDAVKKGQILATLTSHRLGELYSDYHSNKALEKVAGSEYQMAQKLFAKKSMAEKDYLRYKRDYIDAGINRRKAEIKLRSFDLDPEHPAHNHAGGKDVICTEYDIKAPFDGSVVSKDIAVGENFAEDSTQVLFTVSDLNRLWIELRADSSELKQVKAGMSVEVTPLGSQKVYKAKVIYVSRIIDETSRKGFVRAELDNSAGSLHSGEFVLGRIRLDSVRPAVVIPRAAVQLVSGETVVFVPQKGNFITRLVKTGLADGNRIEITSGLKPGEKFVSAGAFELKAVQLTAGMDPHAGHGH